MMPAETIAKQKPQGWRLHVGRARLLYLRLYADLAKICKDYCFFLDSTECLEQALQTHRTDYTDTGQCHQRTLPAIEEIYLLCCVSGHRLLSYSRRLNTCISTEDTEQSLAQNFGGRCSLTILGSQLVGMDALVCGCTLSPTQPSAGSVRVGGFSG